MIVTKKMLAVAGLMALTACVQKNGSEKSSKSKEQTSENASQAKAEDSEANAQNDGNKDIEAGSFALTDEEKDDVAAEVEDALQSVEDEATGQDSELTVSASSNDASAEAQVKFSRECTEDADGSATVHIQRSVSRDFSASKDDKTYARELSRNYDATRTWRKDYQDVRCHISQKFIDPKSLIDINGLEIATDYSRSLSRDVKKSEGESYSLSYEVSGERSIRFGLLEDESPKKLRAILTSDVTRTRVRKNSEGEVKIESNVRTDSDTPIIVVAELGALGLPRLPSSVEIESGKVIAERSDGGKIETQFDHYKLDFKKGLCDRRSGSISGSIMRKDGTSATFKLSFDDKNLSIKFSDGTEKNLDSTMCAAQ